MLGVGEEWEGSQRKEWKKSKGEGVIFTHPVFWWKKYSSMLFCLQPSDHNVRYTWNTFLPFSRVQILSHLSGTSSNNISLKSLPWYPTQKEIDTRAKVLAVGGGGQGGGRRGYGRGKAKGLNAGMSTTLWRANYTQEFPPGMQSDVLGKLEMVW